MRPLSDGYIYNLQVPNDTSVKPGDKYYIRVSPLRDRLRSAHDHFARDQRVGGKKKGLINQSNNGGGGGKAPAPLCI